MKTYTITEDALNSIQEEILAKLVKKTNYGRKEISDIDLQHSIPQMVPYVIKKHATCNIKIIS